ncbi:MAG: phosphoribosylformylglycinamidine synthase [Burkholderiales bacterium]|jgi:phosphoribosylformylglycinamidine synthase|nr:phosphoribosylformylglycinamidine synthase [Burkholderiales bacterium]
MNHTLVTFAGQSALSSFRLKRLMAQLRAQKLKISDISAHFCHFVACTAPLSDEEQTKLSRLLTYGARDDAALLPRYSGEFWVTPRIGTVSPWSSKATDIARQCELLSVNRIERGVYYRYLTDEGKPLSDEQKKHLYSVFFDRMVETVFEDENSIDELFAHTPPKPFSTIPLLEQGRDALVAANQSFGLALTEDEMDYLDVRYREQRRDPTDVELTMFAQANSEHCRHKIFNANWVLDGKPQERSLFSMIRATHQATPLGTIVAYSDNSAIMEGQTAARFFPNENRHYETRELLTHTLMKVETHNHPTAIAPFPGAATGSGGEIRDEGATGIGGKPKAGLVGYTVAHLRIPDLMQPWETPLNKPDRIASPLQIMIDAPLGACAFNNEFGRPGINGYFRTFEMVVNDTWYGYLKPIMIAGGMGMIDARHVKKKPLPEGTLLIQLGGPGFLIGLGGGAASSMASGDNRADLDFDSVQRGNPEIERRAQEVIDRAWQMGDQNPILSIHDVGAGGVSNALPELIHDAGKGGVIALRDIPSEEPGMSPREIWSNEAQERYVLAIAKESLPLFEAIAKRERCPFAVVGRVTDKPHLHVADDHFENAPVDVPLDLILGKPPKMTRDVVTKAPHLLPLKFSGVTVRDALTRVLQFPAVADKSFLITIGDRTVGGLVSRDPMVGPWQVPVADCAVTLADFSHHHGEAMAMGEKTPLATINAPASGRMSIAEALLNLSAADIPDLKRIKLSANWMAAAGTRGEDGNLYQTVKAVSELCVALGVSIPVGKDSMSMRTAWKDAAGNRFSMIAPVSLIVSAFSAVADVRKTLTPLLSLEGDDTWLLWLDFSGGQRRLGGSTLAQVYQQVGDTAPDLDDPAQFLRGLTLLQQLKAQNLLLAYHDISDGGVIVTLLEMAFASHAGLDVALPKRNHDVLSVCFAEELGVVVQIRARDLKRVEQLAKDAQIDAHVIGVPIKGGGESCRIRVGDEMVIDEPRYELQSLWSSTSMAMQALRDAPHCAEDMKTFINDVRDPGLQVKLPVSEDQRIAEMSAPMIATGARPIVAVLREQGVNSQVEMAAAFDRAGFTAVDVHMTDLIERRFSLSEAKALVACGGFSYGDVLGAGGGWAKSILFNAQLYDAFSAFFARDDVLALGVCNGCQMMSQLKTMIPGARHFPRFVRNASEQFEARLSQVLIEKTPSVFLQNMEGSLLPIVVSHGEGRVEFDSEEDCELAKQFIALRYTDHSGRPTIRYPFNPNGSHLGATAFTSENGRVLIMMPHPERGFRSVQLSWYQSTKNDASAWLYMFHNARKWLK